MLDLQGKSKCPKTQLSAPSLGGGLELKKIRFLRKKVINGAGDKETPQWRWDLLWALMEVPFGWLQRHHPKGAPLGPALSWGYGG